MDAIEQINEILDRIHASPAQRCFLRNYVAREGATDIRYAGRHRMDAGCHVIRGIVGGQEVTMIVRDGSHAKASNTGVVPAWPDALRIDTWDARGREMIYYAGDHGSGRMGGYLQVDGKLLSGFDVPEDSAKLSERQRELNSYHACGVAAKSRPGGRLEPIA